MNDQPNPWEADWRGELAGYEAPLQPGDWAGMEDLLDGGAPAPPDAGTMTAAKAAVAGKSTLIKGLIVAAIIITFAGLGYWLATPGAVTDLAEASIPSDTEISEPALDTLPPGYRYDIKTYKQLDRKGTVLSAKYDTSIVPVQYRMDTIYLTDELGNIRLQIDTAVVPVRPATGRLLSSPNRRSGGGTSLAEPPALPAGLTDLAPPTPPARRNLATSNAIGPDATPAAAAPQSPSKRTTRTPDAGRVSDRRNQNNPKRVPYELTPSKPPRERSVPRLKLRLAPQLSSYEAYYQLRLQQIVRDHPVKVVPAKIYNGYYPAYRDDF